MLKQLPSNVNPNEYRPIKEVPEPMRTCESCGKQVISSSAINVIIVVGSPGHPTLKPFQCEYEEHWACSPGCWSAVAKACVDEHMSLLLKMTRSTLGL